MDIVEFPRKERVLTAQWTPHSGVEVTTSDLPETWSDALGRLANDLHVRQYNGYIERIEFVGEYDDNSGVVFLFSDVTIAWREGAGFGVSGRCPRVDDDVETILLCIADLVQDQVARAHVAWPWADDGGFMSVALVDGVAMWVKGDVRTRVGDLREAPALDSDYPMTSDYPFRVVASWTRRWGTDLWLGPSELPSNWSSAVTAVENDLRCWVRKKPLPDFADHTWEVLITEFGGVKVQLRRHGLRGWNGDLMTVNPESVDLSTARATVHLADEVQGDLTGNAWIDWPSAGWDVLVPTVVDGIAMWVKKRDCRPIARIGRLCEDCTEPW